MEEVIIPAGKALRYRCGVEGCSSVNRHFSVISIWEHLASHFAKKNGNRHYNYRCQSCGMHFYNLGMADSCRCPKKTDGRFESIRLDLSSAAIRHDVFFSSYYKRYAIPVLVNDNDASVSRHAPKPDLQRKPSNTKTSQPPPKIPTERSRTPRSSEDPEDSRGMNWPMMRSPSMYADGTPRTPREDDEEEEAEPAYVRAMRSRCQSRAGSPTDMENAGNESAVNSAPPSTNGSQERVSLSQAVENVSKRDTFAWPPPEPTPELLTLSAVRNEPTTSSGHRQDSTPSASEHISPPEPARSQNFKQSSANDGLAQISQADDHFESKASGANSCKFLYSFCRKWPMMRIRFPVEFLSV
ncbi:hypothetical protein GCK32_008922 [Trichostrongylus colubriformis]|uniref:Uncharacterized protein n=1 Tax=Trichostrongylus colubriformis TaxID=6319 RepID=A0AAN8F065_TRICO